MKTALWFLGLGVLGFFPVMLVLSVWDDDEPAAAEVLSAEEQAHRNAELQSFLLNRDGCELAIQQVEFLISRERRGVEMDLETCGVASTETPPEWVARGQAKFLGAQRWDPPVDFSVWFVDAGRGKLAPCAIHLGDRGGRRMPVKHPHRSCASWTSRR